jgi:IS30 family transposase
MILRYDIPKQFKVSTNRIYSWIHWTQRKKIADFYHYLSYHDCKQLKQITKKVNLRFEFYFTSRALDSSNCSYIGKCLEDWLVRNWLLKDDTNKFIWAVTYQSYTLTKEEKEYIKSDYVRVIID